MFRSFNGTSYKLSPRTARYDRRAAVPEICAGRRRGRALPGGPAPSIGAAGASEAARWAGSAGVGDRHDLRAPGRGLAGGPGADRIEPAGQPSARGGGDLERLARVGEEGPGRSPKWTISEVSIPMAG